MSRVDRHWSNIGSMSRVCWVTLANPRGSTQTQRDDLHPHTTKLQIIPHVAPQAGWVVGRLYGDMIAWSACNQDNMYRAMTMAAWKSAIQKWPRFFMYIILELQWIKMTLKVIYHPLYSMNKFVTNKSKMGHKCFLIWGDWLSCDPLRGSHDSQSPHIRT